MDGMSQVRGELQPNGSYVERRDQYITDLDKLGNIQCTINLVFSIWQRSEQTQLKRDSAARYASTLIEGALELY